MLSHFVKINKKIMHHNDVMARPARVLIWKSPGPETRQLFGMALAIEIHLGVVSMFF